METTEWIWMNGEWTKWNDAKLHFITHTFHYGGGAFEGIRVYKTADGPAIFRLRDHMNRLFFSMSVLKMKTRFSQEEIEQATIELIAKNKLEQGYIRPVAYFGYGMMGVNPRDLSGDIGIACWPWGAYLPHELVDIKISSYIRIHPQSVVAEAKITGYYANSIFASLELKDTKYHESLFLDYRGFVAEGPGENFFMVKDAKLKTPKPGSILKGFTRETVMELARKEGISVEECDISPDEAMDADEAFFTGTAAELTPIRSINSRVLGKGNVGLVTEQLKKRYIDTVYGRVPEMKQHLTYVKS